MNERQREIQAALHAARIAAHPPVRGLGQPDADEELIGAPATELRRQALQRRLQEQVLAAGEDGIERRLLERRADGGPYLSTLANDVVAADSRPPAGGR